MSSITTAVAADYRLQQWVQLVKECQNRPSDMTVEQWCDTKGISKSSQDFISYQVFSILYIISKYKFNAIPSFQAYNFHKTTLHY